MSDITQARSALVERIIEGNGKASHAQRRAAFNNEGLAEPLRTLINKVAKHAYKVTDKDIDKDSVTVPADLGRDYVAGSGASARLAASVVQAPGGILGLELRDPLLRGHAAAAGQHHQT